MKCTQTKKPNEYGNINIPDEAFEPRNIKERITTYIDLDLLDELRAEADKRGTGYQTLLNEVLRDGVTFMKTIGKEEQKAMKMIQQHVDEKLTEFVSNTISEAISKIKTSGINASSVLLKRKA